MTTSWWDTWEPYDGEQLRPLEEGTRGTPTRQGELGVAEFPAGYYPACSEHGAMNRVGQLIWRCLVEGCNLGGIQTDDAVWGPLTPASTAFQENEEERDG